VIRGRLDLLRNQHLRDLRAIVFAYTWGRNILGGGRAAVDESFDRYLKAVSG